MAQEKISLVKNRLRLILLMAILIGGYGLNAQNWPSGPHDPSSMVKEGSKYWVFGTGNGIVSRYSTDMVTWSVGPTVFPEGEFPAWILDHAITETDSFSGFFWAPDIIYMNNQYYLYYSCSVWGSRNSCVGLAINKTLDPDSPDFKWVDQGDIGIYSPDFSPDGSGWDVNAIDPAMMRGHDGRIWMVYGSFNKGGIMVTEVDSVTGIPFGPRKSIANSWTSAPHNYGEGEGGAMFYRNGYYYLVYNKGGCCKGIASSYYMVIGRSQNPTGPFVDKSGKPMRVIDTPSGGTIFFRHDDSRGEEDRYFGPGHLGLYRENGIDYVSFHYYNPNGYFDMPKGLKGAPTLGLGMLEWGEDGWPTFSLNFVDDGIYTITNAHSQKAMDVYNHTASNYAYLWQYPADNNVATQKWILKSLGTGEYTIQNYADKSKYLEAPGNMGRLASGYSEGINQKFRIVKDANGKVLIYPSVKDKIFEVPYASTQDVQIKQFGNTNHPCQRWILNPFKEVFAIGGENINLGYNDTVFNSINISSNGIWSTEIEDNSWLEVNPESGQGEAVLSFRAFKNQTSSARTNKLTIRSGEGVTETVLISQDKMPEEKFAIDGEQIKLGYNDTVFSSDMILGNAIWSLEIEDNSWFEVSPQSGKGEATLSLHAFENPTSSARTNKLVVRTVSGITDTVLISQDKKPKNVSSLQMTDNKSVEVYPNPAKGKISIELEGKARVFVYSSLGKQLISEEINGPKSELDIIHFEPGLYIIEINMGNAHSQEILIKE